MISKLMKVLGVVLLVIVAACNSNIKQKKAGQEPSEAIETGMNNVVAQEVIQGGQYTYVRAIEGEEEKWFAISKADIKVGETYHYADEMRMDNFTSKELDRTFETIYFLNALYGKTTHAHTHSGAKKVVSNEAISIDATEGQIMLNDLFENREKYRGKKVLVKGKVVKVNNHIMNKNWIHIQDGTKMKDGANYDITITTSELIELNSVVMLEGVVAIDKDFGAGYKYDLLIEEAVISK
ncbi:hypothetical protein [Carboxylicivirga marina]|uniref:hypothetical protein n=1 Tax=Carboxylicivirga marina TaxID=2800988 RepID=UPI0025924B02|nr:hypothetical protein [uncultured Carboxylicivirga sp.]